MKKEYIFLITAGIILSFLIGFFINSNFGGGDEEFEHFIIKGDKSHLIGTWMGFNWQDFDSPITFYENGTYINNLHGNKDSNSYQVNDDIIILTESQQSIIGTFYFIDGYNKCAMEFDYKGIQFGVIMYRVES